MMPKNHPQSRIDPVKSRDHRTGERIDVRERLTALTEGSAADKNPEVTAAHLDPRRWPGWDVHEDRRPATGKAEAVYSM
jgi:hypothetical protein